MGPGVWRFVSSEFLATVSVAHHDFDIVYEEYEGTGHGVTRRAGCCGYDGLLHTARKHVYNDSVARSTTHQLVFCVEREKKGAKNIDTKWTSLSLTIKNAS